MASVYYPSFASLYPKPGLNAVPTGAVVGAAAGNALGRVAAGVAEGNRARASLDAIADSMEGTSPEVAQMLRSQKSAIPLFGPGGGVGGGGGSPYGGGGYRTGGGYGGTSDAMKFAFGQIEAQTDFAHRQALMAQEFQNRVSFEGLSHSNALARTGAANSGRLAYAAAFARNAEEADARRSERERLERQHEKEIATASNDTQRYVADANLAGRIVTGQTQESVASTYSAMEARRSANQGGRPSDRYLPPLLEGARDLSESLGIPVPDAVKMMEENPVQSSLLIEGATGSAGMMDFENFGVSELEQRGAEINNTIR